MSTWRNDSSDLDVLGGGDNNTAAVTFHIRFTVLTAYSFCLGRAQIGDREAGFILELSFFTMRTGWLIAGT